MREIVYLAGLPRSGSTLLANILAMHPQIHSTSSSPLCDIVQGMRRQWSDHPFLLSQLDDNFDVVHERMKRSTKAFMEAWSSDTYTDIAVDKNRGWLSCLEWLRELYPNFKIIVTLRDLRQVYTSVEKHHRKTIFMDFPDHMEHNIVDSRAENLFANAGVIGGVLISIQNVQDIPDISDHICYWRYEDFLSNPERTTNYLFNWLGVPLIDVDFDNIPQSTKESDSYYRMKYSHKINSSITTPTTERPVSPRILNEIVNRFRWYYEKYYPEALGMRETPTQPSQPSGSEIVDRKPPSIYEEDREYEFVAKESELPNEAAENVADVADEDDKIIAELEAALAKERDKKSK